MKSYKKFILTLLAYAVPTMLIAMLWHFVLFSNLYESLGIYNRHEPIIPLGFASMLVQGFVMAYLYPCCSKGQSSVPKAIKFSLLMGLFLFSVSTLANGAKIQVTSMQNWLFVQSAFHSIQFLVVGIMIGLVNNTSK